MTATETTGLEVCTTEVARRRHLSLGLGGPYPGAEGREGDTLCGLHNGMDQLRLAEFWVGFGDGAVRQIPDLPLCGNCGRQAERLGMEVPQ